MSLKNLLASSQVNSNTGLSEPLSEIDKTIQGLQNIQNKQRALHTPLETPGVFLTSKYDEELAYFQNQQEQRASKQSSGEQFGNFLNQAVVGEIVGGTLEGIGYLADIGDAVKVASGEEVELGNWLTETGQAMRSWTQEVTPVYETSPGKFAPGNWSWWMANGPSVASTLSLLIPAAGVTKGLSMVGKAAGITAQMSKTARLATRGISQAVVSRHMENLMEAGGKYEEIYERNLREGMNEEESRRNASVAASDIYQKNWVMLAQDIPQYLLLGKSFGKASKPLTTGVARELGETGRREGLRVASRYALDAVSEGGEEAYQYVISEMADDLAKSKIDPDYRSRRLGEFAKEDEFWTSVSMGMLGAGVMQTAGRAINNAIQGGQTEDKQRINNVKSYGPSIKMYTQSMRDAEKVNDIEAYESARMGLVDELAGKAVPLGNLDALVTSLEQITEQEFSEETQDRYGLDGEDIQFIKKTFPSIIEEVKEVGKSYEAYAQGKVDGVKYDSDIASVLATLEVGKRRLNKRESDLNSQLTSEINKLNEVGYNKLSPIGQQAAVIDSDIHALTQRQKYIKEQLKKDNLEKDVKDFYSKQKIETQESINKLKKDKQSILKSDTYTQEQKDNDSKINLDSELLTQARSTKSKLEFNKLSQEKREDTINTVKKQQKDRNEGTAKVPQEPQPTEAPEVPAEEPVSETVREETTTTPKETVVETKPYEPNPEDVKRRRELKSKPLDIFEVNAKYKDEAFSNIFEDFESVEVATNNLQDTGILKKEKEHIYLYSDNKKTKLLYDHLQDEIVQYSGMLFLSDPTPYTTTNTVEENVNDNENKMTDGEIDATKDKTPDTEHPDVDTEVEPTDLNPDTEILQGEERLFYSFQKDKKLTKYIEDPTSDFENSTGEVFIDINNRTLKDKPQLKKKIQEGNIETFTQEELDEIPLGVRLKDNSGSIKGTSFFPRGTTIPDTVSDRDVYTAALRALRTQLITPVIKGNKVSLKGFRRDSGHHWNIPNTKSQLNVIEALNTSVDDITIGIAIPGTIVEGVQTSKASVYDKDWNVLPAGANPHGGSVYLSTNKTPNKKERIFKLNKSKLKEDHINIILNAFEQSTKGKQILYTGGEVKGDITNEAILDMLVYHGEPTYISPKRAGQLADLEYVDRLKSKQLYKSGVFLYYGNSGKINLKDIKPDDRKAFISYAKENFNYSIQLSLLGDKFESPFSIGNWEVTEQDVNDGLTWEQHYLKNGWVWTNITEDNNGNVIKDPNIYVDITSPNNIDIQKPSVEKPVDNISPDDVMKKFRPFSSTYYEGQRFLRGDIEVQVDQVKELIGRNIPIEVVNDFIRVVDETGSNLAFGQVKDASIKLYERAEAGTGYHEAFHIVSLYYLTGTQRKKVYDDAAKRYKIDRADERTIEERLAEDFRKYMLSDRKVVPNVKSHRTFFQKLYDFILGLFINPVSKISDLTIENLFTKIENGAFKKAKVRNENVRKYSGYDYLKKIDGFTTDQTINIANTMMYQMLTKNNIVTLEDLSKLSLDPVFKYFKEIRDSYDEYRNTPNLKEEYKVEGERLYQIYDKILQPEKLDNEGNVIQHSNIEAFTELISDQLDALNIRRQVNKFENSNGIDIHNLFNEVKDGEELLQYDKASYENSGKDNLLANVKLFIATLPSNGEIDPYTSLPIMTDFSEAYSKIMMDLYPARNFDDIIKILEQKAEDNLFYRVLLDGDDKSNRIGLKNAPKSFQNQFEIAVYKHRHNFVNIIKDKDDDLQFVDAVVSQAERDLAYEWSLRFYLSGKFINEIDNTINSKEITKIFNKFDKEVKSPLNKDYSKDSVLNNYDVHLTNVANILNEIGVIVTKIDLQNAVNLLGVDSKGDINKHLGLTKLVNNGLYGFFGPKGALNNIRTKNLDKIKQPEELIAKDKGIIEFAKLILNGNVYYQADTALGAEYNTYYVYSQPSLLTEYIKDLQADKNLIQDLRTVAYNKHSQFLKQLEDGAEFDLNTFASYRERGSSGTDYTNIDSKEDMLIKLNGLFQNLIPLPTLADRRAYYFYKGLNRIELYKNSPGDSFIKNKKYEIGERAATVLLGYAKDEEARVAAVKKEIKQAKDKIESKRKAKKKATPEDYKNLILNKHYKKVDKQGVPIFTNDAEGLKYRHFVDFNDPSYNDESLTQEDKYDLMRQAIKSSLKRNVIDTLEHAEDLKLIELRKDKNGNIINIRNKEVGSKLLDKYVQIFGNRSQALYHIFTEYTLNTIVSVVETEKLITMDPVYYKDTEDKIKRLNALVAPGDKVVSELDEVGLKGLKTYNTAILQTFKYNDKELVKKLAPKFAKAYKKQFPSATKDQINKVVDFRLKPYTNIDVTDAQTYVTPEMYKQLRKRTGQWEQADEKAYKVLTSETSSPEELLEAQNLMMQPLKLVYFGPHFIGDSGVPIYDKMSVAVLLPSVVKDTPMEALYNKMISDGIDMIKYDSAVKVGNSGAVEYLDSEGNPNVDNLNNLNITSQQFKYLRKQQVTDPHTAEKRLLGTQVKKVVQQNLRLDESIYKIKGSNKTYTGREIGDIFSSIYSELSNRGLKKVNQLLGVDSNGNINKRKLYDLLREDAKQGNLPYNIVDNLYVDDNGKPKVHLDTLLNRKWIESRLISLITKHSVDLNTAGTDLIQMSDGGLTKSYNENLNLLDEEGRTEIKTSISVFKSIIPDYNKLTFDEKVKWVEDNLEGIGYRIPTQGQNSAIPFVIKEFLPEQYGNTVILPYGFTALTGSDFDIDKLFVARYNYFSRGNKLLKYNFVEGNKENIVNNEEDLKKIYFQIVYNKLSLRDNLVSIKKQIDKAADKKQALLEAWNNQLDTETKINIAEELGVEDITLEVLDKISVTLDPDDLGNPIKELLKIPTIEDFISKNKGKNAYEINHTKAIENRLLDTMFSVLTNEDHILETKTPLDTFTGKLRDMADFVKDKSPLSMLASAAPKYQLQVKDWYIGGGKGIGPFALNNVHHALTQLVGYKVEAAGLSLDLDQIIGNDKIAIVDWLSALINAHVDIAKDPYIFHLNVNEDTYNIVNLLIRAGYGEQTFWVINQEIIKTALTKDQAERKARQSISELTKGEPKSISEMKQAEFDQIVKKYSNPNTILTDKNLKSLIKEDNKNYVYYAKQVGIANAYDRLNKAASKLSSQVIYSRIDNKGFGKTIASVKQFDERFNEHMSDSNFSNLIDKTFLKTLYNNSVKIVNELFSNLLIDNTDGFERIVNTFMSSLNKEKEVINTEKASEAIYTALISKYFTSQKGFGLNKKDIKELFKGETAVGYRLDSLKQKYPELFDDINGNKLLRTLKSVGDREGKNWFIKSLSGDKNDKFLRDSYSDAWVELLEHPNDDIRKLGKDLIPYSFYTSGFSRSLYSFYQDIPREYLTTRPDQSGTEISRSFDEFISELMLDLNSEELSIEFIMDIIRESYKVIDNNMIPEYLGFVDPIFSSVNKNQIKLFILNKEDAEYLGRNDFDQPIYNNLYKINPYKYGSHIVEYVGYTTSKFDVDGKPKTDIDHTDVNTLIYRVVPESGREYKGHKIIEVGYEGSIFEEDFQMVTDQALIDLQDVDGFKDYVFVANEDKEIYKPVEEAKPEEYTEVIEDITEKEVEVEESPFISDESANLIKKIPTGFESLERYNELINAAINMDSKEFESIIEQIKSCNG